MNAGEVVKLLAHKGIVKTESNIKYLAAKYELYNDKSDTKRPGLDRKKITTLISVMSSPLRLAIIAPQGGNCGSITRNKLEYYIRRERIETEKIYGIVLLKNKEDVERVKSFL